MRRLRRHSSPRPRPVLFLETLEDRRLLSAGGLLGGALLPPRLSPPSSEPAPLSRLLTPLEAPTSAAPTAAATTSLLSAPLTLLSPVTAAVQDTDGALLGGSGNIGGASSASTGALGLDVNLNVDVLFIHADNVRLDVGLNPTSPSQPLLSVGLGASVGAGPQTGGLVNLAPQVGIDVGGSGGAIPNVGVSSGGSSAPILGVTVGDPVISVPPILSGGGQGATGAPPSQPGSPPASQGQQPAPPAAVVAAGLPGGARSAVPFLGLETTAGADGGGGSAAEDGSLAVSPVADVQSGGGAADLAVPPPLSGGASDAALEATLAPDAAGLATRFQPADLGAAARSLTDMLGRITPQTGGLAGWLARLQQRAPWLAGLVLAGVGVEFRRRQRRAAKAAARPAAG